MNQYLPIIKKIFYLTIGLFLGSTVGGQTQNLPIISSQPASQMILQGSNAVFNVAISGVGPFTYQWQYNGSNLPNNIITTVAGNGSRGYSGENDEATNASFQPSRLVFDTVGNLYIADPPDNRICKVDTNGIITTVAGSGPSRPDYGWYAGDGGAATNAHLYQPIDVALDATGNMYIADSETYRVRVVNAEGIITTIAGNGNYGYSGDNIAATNASIFQPYGIALSVTGNLYVTDIYNNRIRKVDSNGIITTVAGIGPVWPLNGAYSGDDGLATNASLNTPQGIAFDVAGNLFISDAGNNRIRELTTNGIITTIAGNGGLYYSGDGMAATNTSLYVPTDVAFDKAGNLFIADTYNNRVRKMDPNGIISTVAGNGYGANGSGGGAFSGDDGAATNASLWFPTGLAFDAGGNLYIADSGNYRVREVHFTGIPMLQLTNVQPANAGDYTVIVTGASGSVTSAVATLTILLPPTILTQPAIQGNSDATINITAIGSQPLYYTWYLNSTNLVQSATNASLVIGEVNATNIGQYLVVVTNAYGSVTSQVATLTYPTSLITQPAGQMLLAGSNIVFSVVATGSAPLIYQWQLNGTNLPGNVITTVAGGGANNPGNGGPATKALLSIVADVASDKQGNFYLADYGFCRVQKVDTNGIITTVAGNGIPGYSGDSGPATNASLDYPDNVAVDAFGNVFISEYSDDRIRKVDTNGIITTVAGNGHAGYSGDNISATNTSLSSPTGLAVDNNGNLYIGDYYNNRVRKVDTNGIITTVAGNGNFSFSGDGGAATNASLRYPDGVMVDDLNNLYIADHNNLRVRRVDTNGIITTIAGNGNSSFSGDGGAATNAGIYYPAGMAMDAFGYFFITDQANNRVRQIDPNGIITTVAGNNNNSYSGDGNDATNASLNFPAGVASTGSGSLLIADRGNNRIRKITLGRSAVLSLGPLTTTNAGNYTVIVSNPYGSSCITSSVAPLTVVAFQFSNQTVVAGSNVAFNTVVAGPTPTIFQWYFNQSIIAGATNASLNLTNVQPPNQGNYKTVVSNIFGIIESPVAILTVTGSPPTVVTIQPTNQVMVFGANYNFAAMANGTPPLYYQWQFHGISIPWATNSSMNLTNVQLADEGRYNIIVSNYFGSVTSSYASLLNLSSSLDAPGLIWTNGGSAAWFPETITTHDGVEAAQSGIILNGQQSTLQTTVTGPGTLIFWWMFSPLTVPFNNSLSFSTSQSNNSASVASTSGWQQEIFYLGAGTQTLNWTYARSSLFSSQSTGWVDQVSFTSGTTPPTLGTAPATLYVRAGASAIFTASAFGTPPLSFQWQFNGTDLVNKTNPILILTNVQPAASGNYSLIITNNYGIISTNASLFVQQFTMDANPTNFGTATNGFKLSLNGVLTANPVILFASTDLVNWLPVYTNPPTTGSIQFIDFAATNLPARFYRAKE